MIVVVIIIVIVIVNVIIVVSSIYLTAPLVVYEGAASEKRPHLVFNIGTVVNDQLAMVAIEQLTIRIGA